MEYGYESSLALQDLDNPGDASRGEGASSSHVCLPRACLSLWVQPCSRVPQLNWPSSPLHQNPRWGCLDSGITRMQLSFRSTKSTCAFCNFFPTKASSTSASADNSFGIWKSLSLSRVLNKLLSSSGLIPVVGCNWKCLLALFESHYESTIDLSLLVPFVVYFVDLFHILSNS